MKNQLNTQKVTATFVNDHIVILCAHHGVSIDGDEAAAIIALLEKNLPGNYAIVINRVNDYSVAPVAVYQVLNNTSRLQGIAIVTYREISSTVSDIEKSLSVKPLQVFSDLDAAETWLESFFIAATCDDSDT
jgi:hypothetical protein